jgi:hypothetical protein
MAKSRRRSQRRRRSRKKRGRGLYSRLSNKVGIGALVARYVGQLLKPNTDYPKTRQLMIDSFVYAAIVAEKVKPQFANQPITAVQQPKYGFHTYTGGNPVKGGSGEDAAVTAAAKAAAEAKKGNPQTTTGGRRRRSRKKRRKSRRKSKKRKSRRRRKKSRRRRRR